MDWAEKIRRLRSFGPLFLKASIWGLGRDAPTDQDLRVRSVGHDATIMPLDIGFD
jgi:hypothetical protein